MSTTRIRPDHNLTARMTLTIFLIGALYVAVMAALLDAVRTGGTPLPVDALKDSDLILPPADATLEEVRDLLSDDGLIPG